jgi:hypothetical protein
MNSHPADTKICNDAIRNLFSQKLAAYSRRDPKSFLQLDGVYVAQRGVDEMRPDVDGDCVSACQTVELMMGSTVRVLIPEDTDRRTAIRQLKKLTKWLIKDPSLMRLAMCPQTRFDCTDDDGLPF